MTNPESAPALEPVDDAEVMRLWRACGLPEYFLGNGGTNHKLVAFARAYAVSDRDATIEECAKVAERYSTAAENDRRRAAANADYVVAERETNKAGVAARISLSIRALRRAGETA